MIGRFGLSSQPSSSNISSPQAPHSSSSGNTSGNLSSISMNMNFMKKMSVGLSMPSMDTAAAMMSSVGADKKARSEVEERKAMIAQTIAILEDVHLQTATSHSGLILAYTSKKMSPIVHPGVKFRWFRLPQIEGSAMELVEESQKAWYAPTVDDIGCMICVQCEDNFDQGCSKYLECGPIKADPLLTSIAESAINNGVFEVKSVAVSLGLSSTEPDADHTMHDPNTVLSKDSAAFLQLNGLSTIEVDDQGIFISIPTPAGTVKHKSPSFNTSRRGLRIPSSTGMKVVCAQPSSLVLKLPITRKGAESDGGDKSPATNSGADEVKMKDFLNSSIVAIPWTYVGHNLSPAAYIADNESKLSQDEREKLLREAEEDSINFANTIVALAEFISSVPEGTKELLLCFACDNRLNRDGLALSMRGLGCQPSGATKLERKMVLPWFSVNGEVSSDILAETNESDTELKNRLKVVEEENSTLKRERNELTKQLLEAKEDIFIVKSKAPSLMRSSSNGEFPAEDGSSCRADIPHEDKDKLRELSGKVIELENKLSIITKREAETDRARTDVESKHSKQQQDIEKLKKTNEELTSRANTLQVFLDQQTASYKRLEVLQEKTVAKCEDLELQMKDLEKLKKDLASRDNLIADLRVQLEKSQDGVAHLQGLLQKKEATIDEVNRSMATELKRSVNRNEEYELKLSAATMQIQRTEEERNSALEKIQVMEHVIQQSKSMEAQWQAAEEKANALAAEINHTQKKSESQTKDMKKMMKENAQTLLEFERALARKSGECNELSFRVQELEMELQRSKDQSASTPATSSSSVTDAATVVLSKLSNTLQQHRTSISTSGLATNPQEGPSISERTISTASATVSSAAASAASVFRRLSVSRSTIDVPDNNSSMGDS